MAARNNGKRSRATAGRRSGALRFGVVGAGHIARPLCRDDIVWRFAGVRPLVDDGTAKAEETSHNPFKKTILPPITGNNPATA